MDDILEYLEKYNSNHENLGSCGVRLILYADGSGHFESEINNKRLQNFDTTTQFIEICLGISNGVDY